MCSVAAASGCDFTSSKGLDGSRFDHFYRRSRRTSRRCPPRAPSSTGCAPERGRLPTLSTLRLVCGSLPTPCATRRLRQVEDMSRPCVALLRRALWSTAYWAQREHRADAAWGLTTREREGAEGHLDRRVALRLVERAYCLPN